MTEPREVNPLVGETPDEELIAPEPQGVPAPIAEPEQPIERRSRRAGKSVGTADQATAPEQPKVDLTQFEEFRRYQAERDRQLESERQRAAQLERQMQERAVQEAQGRMQFLEQVMDDETLDADERREARAERDYLLQQTYVQQVAAWEQFKRQQIAERGLDPADPRFYKAYSAGQTGLYEFMTDLRDAELERTKKELAEAKKSAVTPDTLAELVRKELARLTAQTGVDRVDMGEPGAATDEDGWERDYELFNNGRMSREAYLRKWGGSRY